LEQAEAQLNVAWRKAHAGYAKQVAELAGTHDLVDRERLVMKSLDSAALKVRGVEGLPYGAAVSACTEMKRRWEVAARAATAAVTTAATAATAAAGVKTSIALTEATAVAATAASAAVSAAKEAEAGEYAAFVRLDAVGRAAKGLKPRQSAEGASGSSSGGIPTTAEPTAESHTEGATAAATNAPDRDTLVKKLNTFADNAAEVKYDETVSWVESEFSGDFAALTAAAEGGDAKAQFAVAFSSSISGEEQEEWLVRATDQGCIDALLFSGLLYVQDACGQNDGAELEVAKEKAMSDLQMPAANGSATAQHAVGMLLYIFDCDSGCKADFLDAARWIRKAARQGLDVVGLHKLNAVDP
jgi:TPR repeat protein